MPTNADVLVQILTEVTGRPRRGVQAIIDPIATGLGPQSTLNAMLTEAEAEALLADLRQEKAGILRWLQEGRNLTKPDIPRALYRSCDSGKLRQSIE